MVKRRFGIGFVLILILMTTFSADAGDSEYYVMTYAENQTADYPTTKGAEYFSDLVFERTEGRIKIIVKCDAELGTEMEVLKQLEYGGIDLPEFRFLSYRTGYQNIVYFSFRFCMKTQSICLRY